MSSGPKPLSFEEKKFPNFVVEVAAQGADLIYHFWPPGNEQKFLPGFAKFLESGFKATLPSSADVRAEYTSLQESQVLSTHAEFPVKLDTETRSNGAEPWLPRETYFIRVVRGSEYPLADIFLKHRVFENIEKAITGELP